MSTTETNILKLRKIQPTDYFISDTFNTILDDIDSKVLGVDHLTTALHWTEWKAGTAYTANDVVRWSNMKSHQYAKCLAGGVGGGTEPADNVTGSVVTDGDVTWKVMSLTEATDTIGPIVLWLGGAQYSRGDVALYANALYRAKINHTASSTFEPDENNWTEIYASIRPWSNNKYYYVGDTVIEGKVICKCKVAHTSEPTFNTIEQANWEVVGNLARVMEWEVSTNYLKDQVITKDGVMLRSLLDHTSDATDFANDVANWEPVYSSIRDWRTNSYYIAGEVVCYGDTICRCITSHDSGTSFDRSKWKMLHTPNGLVRDWSANTYYLANQLVWYNNNLYRCITANGDSTFDITKWQLFSDSINEWVANEPYVVDQYVTYNNVLYKCINANNDATFTPANWQKVAGGGIETWIPNNGYSVGDVVVHANKIYQCTTAHTSDPTDFTNDVANWQEISACITRIPNWGVATSYVVGDLVAHDQKIYRCTVAHTSDPTQWTQNEEAYWEELSPTINEISLWAVTTDYAVGQLVIHNNKLYRCITAHTSDATTFNNDIANWQEIGSSGGLDPWKANEPYTTANVVIYNNKIYKCNTAHTSGTTFDPTKWDEISSSDIDEWQPSTDYVVGDFVYKDNQLYRCITAHTSDTSNFNLDIANWVTLDTKWCATDWATGKLYVENESVVYNNATYRATTTHVSGTDFETDKANWNPLSANLRLWADNISYKVGDHVLRNGELYECIVANNDASFSGDHWKHINKCNISIWKGAKDANILALLHFDSQSEPYRNEYGSNFTSSIGHTLTLTNNIASGKSLIGNSGYCMSTNSYGEISSPDYTFTTGTEVYTIEFFSTLPNGGDNTTLWFIKNVGIGVFNQATSESSQDTRYFHQVSDVNGVDQSISQNSLNIDQAIYWHHYAYVITNDTLKFYIDGKLIKSFDRANPGSAVAFTSSHGSNSTSGVFIDELRVSSIARYSNDFIPPHAPFADPNYEGYVVGDLVVYDDKIYRAIEDNSDTTFDINKWVEVSKSTIRYWTLGEDYSKNEVVLYGHSLYRALSSISSSTVAPPSSTDFQLLDTTIIKPYEVGAEYEKYEAVSYKNKLYVAKDYIYNAPNPFDYTQWELIGDSFYSDWTSGSDYDAGELVIYNNALYRVVNNVTTASTTPDMSSDYQVLGKKEIIPWSGSTAYKAGTIVIYKNRLYKNQAPIPNTTALFSRDDWTPLAVQLSDWQAGSEYKVGDFVVKDKYLYECTVDNQDITFNATKWQVISKDDGVTNWATNTTYKPYHLVMFDGNLYIAIQPHTSSADFYTDLSANMWMQVSGGSGGSGSWQQVTKLGVAAPLDVDITIPTTNTFNRPPVEVLKFTKGTQDVSTNALTFGVGDGSKFNVDGDLASNSQLVVFDGIAKPNHEIKYPFGATTQMTTGYYSESKTINLGDYKVVEEVTSV